MATSDIDIASQGLGLIRANTISSFDEGTNEADIAKLYYSDFVQDILTRFPWTFATKKRKLNQTDAPVNEYRYAHIVPAEALRIWAVYSSGAVGSVPINDYDIITIEGQLVIISNNTEIWADYTVYTAETNWPGYFTHFAIHAFAALISMPVTDDESLTQQMHALAWGVPSDGERGGKFAVATGIDSQQTPPDSIVQSPFIDARFS